MNHYKSHIRPSVTELLTALTLPAAALAFSQDSSLRGTLVLPQLCSQSERGSGLGTEPAPAPAFTQWTVPINVFGSQIVKFGKQPVQFTLGGRYYAESPDDGPEWRPLCDHVPVP